VQTVVYDGSFEGLLSAIFDVYEYRFNDVAIVPEKALQKNIYKNEHVTITDPKKYERLWKGLGERLTQRGLTQVYKSFLSEIPRIENAILTYVQYVFKSPSTVESDYSNPSVLAISQIAKKVDREKHRMEAFVRFQLTKDSLYYSVVQPDFNVLPLIIKHFETRYADQRWMIYDTSRSYGIYYDLHKTEMIEMIFCQDLEKGVNIMGIIAEEETLYQQLWQQYFSSVNIGARKNAKLHIQHMPKRYWKFLIEKKTQ
jgi:probable DNA metabolism protein